MKIIGIDPGSEFTGYGIVERGRDGRQTPLTWGVIRAGEAPTFNARLLKIHETLTEIIQTHHPAFSAVEDIFYAVNVRSALKLGQARGAILLSLEIQGVPAVSYTPLEIKKALVGYGRATKEQVRDMVRLLTGLRQTDIPLDASDALAAALCHLQTYTTRQHIERRSAPPPPRNPRRRR
jgi:crossover junction endodeoxyribonuclease RuvC